MSYINILKFSTIKDTFTKGMVAALIALLLLTFGTAGQASAHSGSYYGYKSANTAYTMTIQNYWGHTCRIQYQFGNVWSVAYSKFRILSASDTCSVGLQTHTVGQQPAGAERYHFNFQPWHSATGWYQSGNTALTNFDYAVMVIQISNYPFDQYYDVIIDGNDSGGYISVYDCTGECFYL